jgi:hypothetical protein
MREALYSVTWSASKAAAPCLKFMHATGLAGLTTTNLQKAKELN